MTRLAVPVEGITELEFNKRVLAAHLNPVYDEVVPIVLGRARNKSGGGGNVTVEKLVYDMTKLSQSFDVVKSLVDFYGFKDKVENSID